jgi:hypothetical protein
VRLFSRDLELAAQNILHREVFVASIVSLSLVDSNSLLVYTADNTLFHFLVLPTRDSISLHLCGSISFDGVVGVPGIVRGLSWMIPKEHRGKFRKSTSSGFSDDYLQRWVILPMI